MVKDYFIDKVLATTVVGSYPVVKTSGLRSLFDPLHSALETAVTDQIAAGIDIISDGQIRGDMIQAFASKLPGVKGQEVIGKVQPASGPITVGDTRYALARDSKSERDHHRAYYSCPRPPYQYTDVPEQGGTCTGPCSCTGP